MADTEKDHPNGLRDNALNTSYRRSPTERPRPNGKLNRDYSTSPTTYPHDDVPTDQALKRIRTAGSISISPELFEKLYLSPPNKVSGSLRTTFGNPTPLGLVGFILSLTPLACDLMGWRGAGGSDGNSQASIGAYYFFGGLLSVLGGLLEFVLGNTFSSIVFCSYGAFWFAFAIFLTPAFNALGAYAADGDLAASNSSFAFFLLFMGMLSLVFLVCAFRTNVAFVVIFATLAALFWILAAQHWSLAVGDTLFAGRLQVAGGAFAFVSVLAGWWVFVAQMLASVDFPVGLPVGDLSSVFRGKSERTKLEGYSV